jgi:hypothetical protein
MKSVRSLFEAAAVGAGIILLATACASAAAPVTAVSTETPASATAPAVETPVESTPPAPATQGCPLTPAELKQALGDMVGPGEIVIDPSYSGYRCSYTLPAGSLPKKGTTGGTVYTGSDAGSFVIDSHRYADNTGVGIATKGVNTTYGGSSPIAVFDSSYKALREVAASHSQAQAEAVIQYPEIGAGTVSDGAGGFILAGTGDYWYSAKVSNTKFNREYQSNVLEVAKLLGAKD